MHSDPSSRALIQAANKPMVFEGCTRTVELHAQRLANVGVRKFKQTNYAVNETLN